MNVVTIGEGDHFVDLSREIARHGDDVVSITRHGLPNPFRRTGIKVHFQSWTDFNLAALDVGLGGTDSVFVVHSDLSVLKQILDGVVPGGNGAAIYALSSADTCDLAPAFPTVRFTQIRDLLTAEALAVYRKADTVSKVRALRRMAEKARKVLILIYGNPDPDALSSALALRTLFKRNADTSTIAYTGELGRVENLAMIQTLSLPVEKFVVEKLSEYDLIALVDGQPHFLPPELDIKFDIVIDHHPKSRPVQARFVDIRPEVGSTASILTCYLLDAGEKINRRLASALLYGLRTDTQQFHRVLSDEDLKALRVLSRGADQNTIRRIELSHFPIDTLDYFGIALVKRIVAREVVFTNLGPVKSADICVHVAEFFIGVTNIAWSIVAGVYADTLVVVFRCDGYHSDAGKVARAAFEQLGRAGGHRTMARAEIPVSALREECPHLASEEIEFFLLKRLAAHLRSLRRMIRDHRAV